MNNESRYRDFDEHMASLDIERQKKINIQSAIAIRKIESDRSKKLEKQRVNEAFWRGVMRFITQMTVVLVAAYMFFNFI